jgi:alkanesulfonate monooxygenase SsuD/methylene tetrahydromethanopterin reductase-like flavin-dependent oxidoreductase (luciferase family)
MGRGVVLRDPLPWADLRQVVETAEETGYGAVFVPEIAGREAFSTLASFGLLTSQVRLGTGVVTVWSRSPVTVAMGAATVHDLSGERLILGLGAGSMPAWRRAHGSGSILDVVRQYVRVVREALSGQPVGPDDLFGAEGFALGLAGGRAPPRIWLGALGDRMVRLAGEIADGVLLNWCTPERVAEAAAMVRDAAAGAGRDPHEVAVAVYVRACLGVDERVALGTLKPMAGQYARSPHYLRQFRAMGLEDQARAAGTALAANRPDEVPEAFVRTLCVTGGRKEALARFDAYEEAGADLVLCYPVTALEPFSSLLGTILAAAPSPSVER